jgi:hypothetical protein
MTVMAMIDEMVETEPDVNAMIDASLVRKKLSQYREGVSGLSQ